MTELPPLFAGELSRHLYNHFLSTVPLFRNLAPVRGAASRPPRVLPLTHRSHDHGMCALSVPSV
jgi:hypothetical protein